MKYFQIFTNFDEKHVILSEDFLRLIDLLADMPLDADMHNDFVLYRQYCKWAIRKLEYNFVINFVKEIEQDKKLNILDVGSGVVPLCNYFSKHNHTVIAFDNDFEIVESLNNNRINDLLDSDVLYLNSNCTFLPFQDNVFDVVTSVSVFEHVCPGHDYLSFCEIYRVLKPGGNLIFTCDVSPSTPRDYNLQCWSQKFRSLNQPFHSNSIKFILDQLDDFFLIEDKDLLIRNLCNLTWRDVDEFWCSTQKHDKRDSNNRNYLAMAGVLTKRNTLSIINDKEKMIYYIKGFTELMKTTEFYQNVSTQRLHVIEGFEKMNNKKNVFDDIDDLKSTSTTVYQQETEIELLLILAKLIQNKKYIDIGSERGSFIEKFLTCSPEKIVAIEPNPVNFQFINEQFKNNKIVSCLPYAIHSIDTRTNLYLAENEDGTEITPYASLIKKESKNNVQWNRKIEVECRTIDSLVRDGLLEPSYGIMKVDTEGNDLEVIKGSATIHADVIMIEFWKDMPNEMGKCPWELDDLITILKEREYDNYFMIKRRGEFETIQINNTFRISGDWGNVIFIHNSIYDMVFVELMNYYNHFHECILDYMISLLDDNKIKQDIIQKLKTSLEERLNLIHELNSQVKTLQGRDELTRTLSTLGESLQEQAQTLDRLLADQSEKDLLLQQITGRDAELATLQLALEERLNLINELNSQVKTLQGREELSGTLSTLGESLQEQAQTLDRLLTEQSEKDMLLQQIRGRDAELATLQLALEERLNLIHELNSQVKTLQGREELSGTLSTLGESLQEQAQTLDRLLTEQSEKDLLLQQIKDREEQLEASSSLYKDQISSLNELDNERLSSIELLKGQINQIKSLNEKEICILQLTCDARLSVIEEQARALDAYRRWHLMERLKMWLSPRLGVFYQYSPKSIHVPSKYNKIKKLISFPKISIVTPSYNQADFIERTINSIQEQNYPNLEYIVQDGASSDGTRDILKRYDKFLTSWESKKDSGQTNAINVGFSRSSGEIMGWLNSDDLLMPGALNYIAHYFYKHPKVDVVYGQRILIDEYDREIGRWILPSHDPDVLKWADFIPQETIFWRRSLWEKVNGLDEKFNFAMDWDMISRFIDAGANFVLLPRFLGAFRIHPNQKTSSVINERGNMEMNWIRERVHGRPVTNEEINKGIRRYMYKHIIYHKLYEFGVLRY